MRSSSDQAKSAADSDANPVAVFIYRALTAKGRNGFACLAAKGNHDGVINNPVTSRQFFPQGKFRLFGRSCFNVAQSVGNSVHMRIDTNGVLAVSKRNNKIGCFAANAFYAQ
jgi:hypothetical protein